MTYQARPSEYAAEDWKEASSVDVTVVKVLPMHIPENVLRRDAERKRIKKSVLSESEERVVFERTLYLPYLDFTYQFTTEKGFLSKQTVISQGRSVVLALREVNFGFYPDLTTLAPQLVGMQPEADSIVRGIDSTLLVNERLEELKTMLSDYDRQLQDLSRQFNSLVKSDGAKQYVKDVMDHLRKTRETRWKMFADGLKLPSKIDLKKLQLLEGSLFYMPYFIVKLTRRGESRFLVWDREGKENESIAEELTKNSKFRDLVQSHIDERRRVSDSDGSDTFDRQTD